MTMTMPNVAGGDWSARRRCGMAMRMPVRSARYPEADGTTSSLRSRRLRSQGHLIASQTRPRGAGWWRRRAAENERAAVNHSDGTPPTRPMDSAANALYDGDQRIGATATTHEPLGANSMPSCLVTAGSSASRAVMPGMSPTAPAHTQCDEPPEVQPHTMSTTGMSDAGGGYEVGGDGYGAAVEVAPPTMPMAIWGRRR